MQDDIVIFSNESTQIPTQEELQDIEPPEWWTGPSWEWETFRQWVKENDWDGDGFLDGYEIQYGNAVLVKGVDGNWYQFGDPGASIDWDAVAEQLMDVGDDWMFWGGGTMAFGTVFATASLVEPTPFGEAGGLGIAIIGGAAYLAGTVTYGVGWAIDELFAE